MTILHIITRLILGGAQQNTVISCGAQRRGGHAVTLSYGPIYGPEGSLLDEAQRCGVRPVEIQSMGRALSPIADTRCYRQLRSLIRELKPDVVHTHSSKAGILGRAAAWREQVPAVIHTVHGLPFHERQNRFVHQAYVNAERWAARRCHHLIAIAPAMVEAFNAQHIAGPHRFTVIPSGVETARFRVDRAGADGVRSQWGVGPDDPVLGIVARLDPLKGHDDLLDIYPQLRRHCPRLRMVFVGDGWHRPRLERRIAAEGLAENVVLTGLVPHREMSRVFSAMTLKALPSYQEGQSRTLVEALLCGCGIVAYNAGGIGSICIDGQTGKLVPVGDKQALADAINWMLEHPDECAMLTNQGQIYVRRMFDADSMVDMIERVYYEVLNRSRR